MKLRAIDDRGESLVEILVAVLILGITAAAIMTGLMTSVKMSDVHRKQATAGAEVRSYAESVELAAANGGYKPCGATSAYVPVTTAGLDKVHFTAKAGYTPSVIKVEYWQDSGPGTTWTWASTPSSPDLGIQRVTLRVSSADSRASEKSVILLRNPVGRATCPTP